MDTVTFFKALSDTTRLRCLLLLAGEDELCVCDLTNALALSQPRVSHHLGNLRKSGLVQHRKQGQWTFYRLHPELPGWARSVIETCRQGVAGQPPFDQDLARLHDQVCQAGQCG